MRSVTGGWAAVAMLAIAVSAVSCGPTPQSTPDTRTDDEAAIRALFQRNAEAGNRQDVGGVVATYWPDGDAWVAGRPRASIRQTELDWQAIPGFRGWKGRVESIRFLGSDAALVECTGTTLLDDGEIAEQTSIVMSRRDGEWKISAWRVMVIEERRSGTPTVMKRQE
jgi:uncharacterized protein (TIGR02246 family)